jgi:seryl-tRNA synthetase
MQQELFKINSKENLRYIKDNESIDRVKQLDIYKRNLNREVIELKRFIEELQEQIKIVQNENKILEDVATEKKVNAWSSLNKQDEKDEIIDKLREEMADLKGYNDKLRSILPERNSFDV